MDIRGISSHGKDAVQFRVSSIKDLQVIVDPVWSPFFEKKREPNKKTIHPNGFSGFVSPEGNFFVNLINSKTKVGK